MPHSAANLKIKSLSRYFMRCMFHAVLERLEFGENECTLLIVDTRNAKSAILIKWLTRT